MSNLTKFEFMIFNISKRNYLSLTLYAKLAIEILMKNHQSIATTIRFELILLSECNIIQKILNMDENQSWL